MGTQRRYLDPLTYAVGKDIDPERYQEALLKIADWFAEVRKTKEPALLAKQLFQCCLDGTTREGEKWFAAATATLEKRVRSMCRFDIVTMQPLRTGSEKTKKKKARERELRDRKRPDTLIPDEMRKEMRKDGVTYGDNANVFLSTAEERKWQEMYDSYRQQFPELRSINAEAELRMLCDLHTLAERHRMKLLKGEAVSIEERVAVADELQRIKKALGIHPDQLAKRTKTREDTSIGAAAARLEAMGNYRELREKYWIEELLQIWQMFMTLSADGLTYQLDEVGLFGLTRSKPCECPRCGQRVFAGLSIDEIEQYLVKKGVLKLVAEGGRPAEAQPAGPAAEPESTSSSQADVSSSVQPAPALPEAS